MDALVAQAKVVELADRREWLRLGHWRPRISGRRVMPMDPGFFLSREGRTDPEAELEATIRSLFRPPTEEEI